MSWNPLWIKYDKFDALTAFLFLVSNSKHSTWSSHTLIKNLFKLTTLPTCNTWSKSKSDWKIFPTKIAAADKGISKPCIILKHALIEGMFLLNTTCWNLFVVFLSHLKLNPSVWMFAIVVEWAGCINKWGKLWWRQARPSKLASSLKLNLHHIYNRCTSTFLKFLIWLFALVTLFLVGVCALSYWQPKFSRGHNLWPNRKRSKKIFQPQSSSSIGFAVGLKHETCHLNLDFI